MSKDVITLTIQQIHELTGIPLYIIKRDMYSNALANFRFSQKTRVATPAAVEEWLAKHNPATAPPTIETSPSRPRATRPKVKPERLRRIERASNCLI